MADSNRAATLEGVLAARRLHQHLDSRSLLAQGIGRIDVFRAAMDQGAMLLFRPLDGPLGLYLDKPAPGILISTKRELHVQRFTSAHELGHFVLQHQPSVDTEVGLWRGGHHDLQEVAADAFAGEFLLPKWLYLHHAKRHSWFTEKLRQPEVVYQLSLRLGASYEATCWGLLSHKILELSAVQALVKYSPKALKAMALDGFPLANPWANVWVITEHDNNLLVEGGPEDIFIFRLSEHAGSGYLWDKDCLADQGMKVLADQRVAQVDDETCGGDIERVLVTCATEAGEYQLRLSEKRPWVRLGEPLSELALRMALEGKEMGLPRFFRRTLAVA